MLATSSDKGTLIRIFSTDDGTALQEVRRGSDKAEIYCISFDKNANWIACSSDKGTIHIFKIALSKITLGEENPAGEEEKKEE